METEIRSRRILILDDEPGILELLDDYFRSLDFEPVTTSQWTEALEQITHTPPDLILLDLHMQTIQGESVLEFIREHGHTLPVIIISAYLNEEKKQELEKKGANAFVAKPFRLNDLVDTVNSVLGPSVPGTPVATSSEAPVEAMQTPGAKPSPPPPAPKPSRPPVGTPEPVPPDSDATPMASAIEQDIPTPPAFVPGEAASHLSPHRRRPRRPRKSQNYSLYVVISLVCLVASIVVVLLQKLPGWMSSKLEEAVEKSIQAETQRGAKAIEGLSEDQKEGFEKSLQRKVGTRMKFGRPSGV